MRTRIPVHQIILNDGKPVSKSEVKQTASIDKFFDSTKYEHMLWNDQMVKDFIRQYFHPSVSMAYNSFEAYAYKADLARYCILYVLGGWYIDSTMTVASPPPEMEMYDMFLVRDFYAAKYTAPWQIANGLIYSKPGHPVMKKMVEEVTKNAKEKYYGPKSLSVSGPELFGRVIAYHGYNEENTKYLIGNHTHDKSMNRKVIMHENKAFTINKTSIGGQTGIRGTNSYVELWESKKVYGRYGL